MFFYQKEMNYRQCRICLDEDDMTNLIAPCRCNGSVKYVHRDCIQTWIRFTENPDLKKKCSMCQTEYICKPRPSYLLEKFCVSINFHPVLILFLNSSVAVIISFPATIIFSETVRAIHFLVPFLITLFALLFLQILNAINIAIKHAIQCNQLCSPTSCRLMVSSMFLILVMLPIYFAQDSEYIATTILSLSPMFAFFLSVFVSSLFKGLTNSLVKIGGEVLNFPVEYEETVNPLKFNEEKESIFVIEEKGQNLIDV